MIFRGDAGCFAAGVGEYEKSRFGQHMLIGAAFAVLGLTKK